MAAGSDYIEMAQLLGDAGLPAEAQTVLEKGMSVGLISDQQRERTNRLLTVYKTRAEADKMSQAQLAAGAPASWTASITVKLGEVYYGSGDYENAAATINRVLQAKFDPTDEGYVYLGRAQVQLKNVAGAKQAFAGLKSIPKVSPRVLRLYQLYSDTLH
jgi:predicted Zn-dependent protease